MPTISLVQLAQNRAITMVLGHNIATQVSLSDAQNISPILMKCVSLRQLTLDITNMDLGGFSILLRSAIRSKSLTQLTLANVGLPSVFREVLSMAVEVASSGRPTTLNVIVKIDAPSRKHEAALREVMMQCKSGALRLELQRCVGGRWVMHPYHHIDPNSSKPAIPTPFGPARPIPRPPTTARPNFSARHSLDGGLDNNEVPPQYSPPRLRSPLSVPTDRDGLRLAAAAGVPHAASPRHALAFVPANAVLGPIKIRGAQHPFIMGGGDQENGSPASEALSKQPLHVHHARQVLQRVDSRMRAIEDQVKRSRSAAVACISSLDAVTTTIGLVKADLARLL